MFSDPLNSGVELPSTDGITSNKMFIMSTYLNFSMTTKDILKLPVVTQNVPCTMSTHFKVAVNKFSSTSAVKEMVLCSLDHSLPYEDAGKSLCYWVFTCACPKGSLTCLIFLSFSSGPLEVAGGSWRIQDIGPAWTQ